MSRRSATVAVKLFALTVAFGFCAGFWTMVVVTVRHAIV